MATCKICGYPIDANPVQVDGKEYHKECVDDLSKLKLRPDAPTTKVRLLRNYERYKEYTKAHEWNAIMELNCTPPRTFGYIDMSFVMSHLPEQLKSGEVVMAFAEGRMFNKYWLITLTDRRFLFLYIAAWTGSLDTQSIYLKHIRSISTDQQKFFEGKILIDAGSRSYVIADCGKRQLRALVDTANEWIDELEGRKLPKAKKSTIAEKCGLDKLEKLADLKDRGALSEEEYATAKAKILTAM